MVKQAMLNIVLQSTIMSNRQFIQYLTDRTGILLTNAMAHKSIRSSLTFYLFLLKT